MKPSVSVVHELVSDIEAVDLTESEHRADALAWLASTDDVFRRVKPSTPGKHLVSYVVMVDPIDRSIFLVDHINAGLWLPSGGHVEPDEIPPRRPLGEPSRNWESRRTSHWRVSDHCSSPSRIPLASITAIPM